MKLSDLTSRLTGISTPIGGASWKPKRADASTAREVLDFLEDRRALYSPYEVEMPGHVVESILQIRRFLTDVIGRGDVGDELRDELMALRAACRKFIEMLGPDADRIDFRSLISNSGEGWFFNQSLGELRGVFGIHIARLCALFDVDVPDTLVTILPLAASADDGDSSMLFRRFRDF